MRTEWAAGRSRVKRWAKEVELLQAEMFRAMAFFLWKADWWGSRTSKRDDAAPDIISGINAYAHCQSSIYTQLARSCVASWRKILHINSLDDPWPTELCSVPEVNGNETELEFEWDDTSEYSQGFALSSEIDE